MENYQLHYHPGTASLVVHWLLIELDLPHQLRKVDFASNEQKSAEYLKLNPSGVVPTLIVDDKPIGEFAAISMYLADKHSYGELAPEVDSPLRGDYNQWMFYISNTIQPIFRMWFYPQDLGGTDEQVKAIIQERIEGYFERVNLHFADGRHYLLGDKLSTADFLLTMMMRWSRNMPNPADSWPHLAEFATRMKSRDSFQEVYKREGISDWL